MNNNTLIKHPDTDKNGIVYALKLLGGLNINETNSGASSVMYEVLSQFGKKVFA